MHKSFISSVVDYQIFRKKRRFLSKIISRKFVYYQEKTYLCTRKSEITDTAKRSNAEIAQLVEHNLAKVGVASSSLVFRSLKF